MNRHKYSPAEMCELLQVSKSTLFRWEAEPWFPAVPRDSRNQREYGIQHIRSIGEWRRQQYARNLERSAELDEETPSEAIARTISIGKFLEGDKTGLQELAHYELSADTIRLLLRTALDRYEPDERVFSEIIALVLTKSRELDERSKTA